jgi:hypothetical protein
LPRKKEKRCKKRQSVKPGWLKGGMQNMDVERALFLPKK